MNDSDSFFDSGRRPPSGDASRPKAVNPQTGRAQSWQRASNYASPLDNPHGLMTWKMRELVKGISLRPDLARLLLTGAVLDDKAKADEVIAAAHAASEIDGKANEGTAVHAALSRAFLFPDQEVPAEYVPHVTAFAAELARNGLSPRTAEVRVMCVALGVIGHLDWIVRTSDGRFLVLDVKTGNLGDAKRKFAVQCAAYAQADYTSAGDGGPWVDIPWALDRTEAILAHVDPETGATALYRVDLALGFYGATLAEKVRGWSKIEVLSPYTPVHPSIPQTNRVLPESSGPVAQQLQAYVAADGAPFSPTTAEVARATPSPVAVPASSQTEQRPITPMEMIVGATSQQTIDMAHRNATGNGTNPAGWTHELQVAAEIKASELHPGVTVNEHGGSGVTVNEHPVRADADLNRSVEEQRAELMAARNDKATLQKIAGSLGCKDLAHNRLWLADWIIARRGGATEDQSAAFAKSKGTIPIDNRTPAEEVDRLFRPHDDTAVLAPTPAEQTPFALKHIAEAASAEDIERFRANIVGRSGDMAWTDEMAEAARERLAELPAVVSTPSVLDLVRACNKPQDIAELWLAVTVGGSAPELWTDEIRKAADARLVAIQAAQPPPPANPYGPQ